MHNRSCVLLGAVSLLLGCASAPDARDALAPCAQARLAREFVDVAAFAGCYDVVDGPPALLRVGVVVLSELPQERLDDEPPKYALATTQPLFSTPKSLKEAKKAPVTTSWEQLSAARARLVWLQGIRGVEACVAGGDGGVLDGSVVIVDDVAPYAHPAGRLVLKKTSCPS